MQHQAPPPPPAPVHNTIICTAACFDSAEDPRVGALIGAAALASALGIPFLVLNASTLERLSLGLAAVKAIVVPAKPELVSDPSGGATMREALLEGWRRLGNAEGTLAWMEPEHQDVVRWLPNLATAIFEGRADVVVPRRAAPPTEAVAVSADCAAQHHAEAFGSLYFDAQLAAVASAVRPPKLDWFFGVLLVRSSLVRGWVLPATAYEPRAVAFLAPLMQLLKTSASLETPEVNYVSTPRATAMAAWAACTALVDPAAVNAAQIAQNAASSDAQLHRHGGIAVDGGAARACPTLAETTKQWERLARTIQLVGEEIRNLSTPTDAPDAASPSANASQAGASSALDVGPSADGQSGGGSRYRLEDLLPKSALEAMRQPGSAESR